MSRSDSIFEDPSLADLSEKERLFVLAYVDYGQPTFCNATRSAKAAGYKSSKPGSLRAMGCQVKNRAHVSKAILDLLNRRVMSVEEALVRLSDIIRGPLVHLVDIVKTTDEQAGDQYEIRFNFARAIRNGHGHLIKEMKETSITREGITTTITKVTMPSSLHAMQIYFRLILNSRFNKVHRQRDPGAGINFGEDIEKLFNSLSGLNNT